MPSDTFLLPPRPAVEHSGRPTHRHTCRVKENADGTATGHFWLCDSPYCEELERQCDGHGGEKPRRF